MGEGISDYTKFCVDLRRHMWMAGVETELRRLFELQPMAFLIEKAGGGATDGKTKILEIYVEDIGQPAPSIQAAGSMWRRQRNSCRGPVGPLAESKYCNFPLLRQIKRAKNYIRHGAVCPFDSACGYRRHKKRNIMTQSVNNYGDKCGTT